MQCIIRCAYLNPDLPVAGHGEISTGAEMTFPIREQVNVISAHVHIKHGVVERNANIRSRLASFVIDNSHGEDVGAKTIRVDVQRDSELVVSRSY